jgi:hypothetical protein
MTDIEFKPWPKIGRKSPFEVTITEKLNGTNACIVLQDGKIAGVQSRNRFITPDNDNFGFASWVAANEEDLLTLGDGYHYGEWTGPGIQKNPHALEEKGFYLFNSFRWRDGRQQRPECCNVVPVMYEGTLKHETIDLCLNDLEDKASPDQTPEGIVVFYHAFKMYTKHTLIAPDGKWRENLK